jgi:transposase InsO family protein
MGQVLHGSATTTEAVRRAIQHSQESLRALATRYGVNPKTIFKWRKRSSVADLPTGPREPKSSVLSVEEEAIIVAFRRHTLLPLDDCLYSLQATIPHLTRSSLHRCLQRHGISRLPDVEGDKPTRKKFKSYPIGFFHIDIAEVQTAEGKLYLFVAIDRTSKFAFVQLVESANRLTASAFLVALIAAVPYKIHTILTDNGIQFRFAPRYADGPTARYMTHLFNMRCRENGIEHRFTKINHPWTNGQVERMNRTIKEATVKRYHYDTHEQLKSHLANFVDAYNFARRLKTLKGLTPYEFIAKAWTKEPKRFTLDPIHQMPGLNTPRRSFPSIPLFRPAPARPHAARRKMFRTVAASHFPPRAVAMPRALRTEAIWRRDFAPAAWASRIPGLTVSAWASASALLAAWAIARTSDRRGGRPGQRRVRPRRDVLRRPRRDAGRLETRVTPARRETSA